MIVLAIMCIFIPFLMLAFEKKYKAFNSVIACYGCGFIMALQPWIKIDKSIAQNILGLAIVMAIIFLLIGSDLKLWFKTGKSFIKSSLAFFLIVPIMSSIFTLMFVPEHTEFFKIAGMLTGVYIGSIPNLFAVGKVMNADLNLLATMQIADIFFSGVFSLVILSPLIKRFYGFLPSEEMNADFEISNIKDFDSKESIKLIFIGVTIFLIGYGINYVGEFQNSQLVILTIVSVLAVLYPLKFKVTAQKEMMTIGEYFLLIFCVTIGSQINFSEILAQKNITLFALTFTVILASIIMHILFCYLFKIPRDVAIITMTAGIYSPAFVPAVAKSLNNKSVLIGGMAAGLVGLAIGSYIGLLVCYALKTLF